MDKASFSEEQRTDFKLGTGVEEITPPVGTPLSGFVARQNRPSTHIDSALFVRALALQGEAGLHFLLNFDLLGINSELQNRLLAKLEENLGADFVPENCLLVATHTHSGPVLGLLAGEGAPDPAYLDLIASRAARAARTALAELQPVYLYTAEVHIPGLTYNRRALLPDGRVSISPTPDLPVVGRGPLDERATLLLWQDTREKSVAAILTYACHGVAVLSQAIGADIPGDLAGRLGRQLGAPCLYLQGAAGDVNPTTVTAGRADLLAWVDQAMEYFEGIHVRFKPTPCTPFRTLSAQIPLSYAPLPGLLEAEENLRKLKRLASGELSAPDLQGVLSAIKNTLNLPDGEPLDAELARFVAHTLAEAGENSLRALRTGRSLPPRPLRIAAWRIGEILFVFLACELFSSTGARIRGLSTDCMILPVSYLAPLLGYVPDQEAIRLGGYEVNDAWRFYGQPAPFEPAAELRIQQQTTSMLKELLAG